MGADRVAPLEEIERAVQERAADISLDMGSDTGGEKLRALIADEVARWSLDHRRGIRPFDVAQPNALAERAYRNLAGYGPLEPLLADDDVWEIMINAPDQIFVKRHSGASGYHHEVFHDTSTSCARSRRSSTMRQAHTASSIRPRGSRTPSSTTGPASTSCTAT